MTIRLRLTLLYGLVFLAAGVALVAANYVLLDHNLPNNSSSGAGQDVVLRANKLADPRANVPMTGADRAQLRAIASGPPGDAVRSAENLPKDLGAQLLADLPSNVSAQALSSLLRQSGVALAIALVVALGLGWFIAGRTLRPLRAITATAQQLSDKNLHLRIGLVGPDDELTQLAATFDGMLERLDTAFSSQRRFVADASHELRTPLTIMRTELDVTMRHHNPERERLVHTMSVMSEAVDRSERLVASLLALATSDHGVVTVGQVDLGGVVATSVARAHSAAVRRGIEIAIDPQAPCAIYITGDAELLERLIDNLVDNAVRHNVDGGTVRIMLRTVPDHLELIVVNTGAIVSPDDINALFEPFHRATRGAGDSRGFGLGLAIVRSVVTAHHGEIYATANPEGGLTIRTTLPLHDTSPDQTPPA